MSFCGVLRTALGGRPHFTDGETKRGEVTQQVSVRAHHPDLYLDLKIQSEFLATVLMCLSFFFFLFFCKNLKKDFHNTTWAVHGNLLWGGAQCQLWTEHVFLSAWPPCWCISLTPSPKDPLMKLRRIGVSLSLSNSKQVSFLPLLGFFSPETTHFLSSSLVACLSRRLQELASSAEGGWSVFIYFFLTHPFLQFPYIRQFWYRCFEWVNEQPGDPIVSCP